MPLKAYSTETSGGAFRSDFGSAVRSEEVLKVLVSDAGSRNFTPLGCPAVCRIVVAIGSYESQSKKSESVEAHNPDMLLSDLRSAITTSRKSRKTEKSVLDFRRCNTSARLGKAKF